MRRPTLTSFTRVWLPVLVVASGLIAVAVNPSIDGLEGAAHIVGAGLAIWLLNLLVRIGISGDRDRRTEIEARAYFSRHGHWPDEAPEPARRPAAQPQARRPAHGRRRVRR